MYLLPNILPGFCVLLLEKDSCTAQVDSVISYSKSGVILLKVQELYYKDTAHQRCYLSTEHHTLKRVPRQDRLTFVSTGVTLPARFILSAFHSTTPLNEWDRLTENMSSVGAPMQEHIHRIETTHYAYTGVINTIKPDEQGMMLLTYRDGAQLRIRPTDSFEFRFGIRSKWCPVDEAFVLRFDETK
jgi:hypothetical protein